MEHMLKQRHTTQRRAAADILLAAQQWKALPCVLKLGLQNVNGHRICGYHCCLFQEHKEPQAEWLTDGRAPAVPVLLPCQPTKLILLVCVQLGIIPFAGVDIAAFEIFKEHLLFRYHGDPPPMAILGAGMMSSSIAQFASYPLALVRTRLQVIHSYTC